MSSCLIEAVLIKRLVSIDPLTCRDPMNYRNNRCAWSHFCGCFKILLIGKKKRKKSIDLRYVSYTLNPQPTPTNAAFDLVQDVGAAAKDDACNRPAYHCLGTSKFRV